MTRRWAESQSSLRMSAHRTAVVVRRNDGDDWKMFAPLRRGEPISPHAKVVAALKSHAGGVTAAALAAELLQTGSVIGMKAPVTKRIEALLDELEQAAQVERIPDGRYRAVRIRGPR